MRHFNIFMIRAMSMAQIVGGAIEMEIDKMRLQGEFKKARRTIEKAKKLPKCKWCNSKNTRALNNNGIRGPGYAEWNHVCNDCGKVQPV
jgi:hypothetical protein